MYQNLRLFMFSTDKWKIFSIVGQISYLLEISVKKTTTFFKLWSYLFIFRTT